EPTISILDRGQTIVFSDQGPGIPNKRDAMRPSFTSATRAMKKYIRGVGSGLPIVEEYIRRNNGTLTIEDNLGHGTIVTVSLVRKNGAPTESAAPSPQGTPGRGAFAPETPSTTTPQANTPVGFPATTGYGTPAQYPAAQPGSPWPYGAPSHEIGAGIAAGQQAYPSGYPGYGTQAAGGWAAAYPQSQWGATPAYPGSMPGYPGGTSAYPTPAPGYPAAPPAGSQTFPGYPVQPAGYSAPGSQAVAPSQMSGLPMGTGYPTGSYAGTAGMPGEAAPHAGAPKASGTPLSDEQIAILTLFTHHEGIGPKELTDELGISGGTGSRRLATLQKMGYIIKQGQKYRPTDMGRQVANQSGPLTNGNR
ncbi:MAG: winged helix-turn-helix transcriptional regulator, partial [Coriobacteriia bacterium]|nr:winged helix-turn-helix transcriptional regulator [Coriobacteriia bacterium]